MGVMGIGTHMCVPLNPVQRPCKPGGADKHEYASNHCHRERTKSEFISGDSYEMIKMKDGLTHKYQNKTANKNPEQFLVLMSTPDRQKCDYADRKDQEHEHDLHSLGK
jgi:hypothetical protein